MLFSKKWLKNDPKFLLHFLIYIDVLMLCKKFESIPTTNFQVTAILKNGPKSKKYYSILGVFITNAIMQMYIITAGIF